MLLFGVVSYKVRPPRLVSYACLYTTLVASTGLDKLTFAVAQPICYKVTRCMLQAHFVSTDD